MKPSIIFLAKVINRLNFVKFHFGMVDTAIIREDVNLQKVYIPIFLYLKKKGIVPFSNISGVFFSFCCKTTSRRYEVFERSNRREIKITMTTNPVS